MSVKVITKIEVMSGRVCVCVFLFVPIGLYVNTDEHHASACCCVHIFKGCVCVCGVGEV